MATSGIEVARAYVTIVPSMEGSQKAISQELGAAVDKEGTKAGKTLGQKLTDGAGSVLKASGKILGGLAVSAATTAVAGVTAITKQALSSFKDYEQLTGGVEKLFGDTASTVMQNASKAFATAGLDANAYMEQVTGVAASLIASLDGDTEAAARAADMAIQDMSDNANVFGSDIESIQNAYSGFAKNNYGMLDNLKLGYQGTKDEMQRLLDDAEKLSGVHYELGNYADMVEAIHVIQTEMNIAGTTAKEALGTIEGSMNMAKGAWTNFVTALAGGGDITETLNGLKTAIFGVEGASNGLVNNVIPVVEKVINSVTDVLPEMISSFLPTVISTIQSVIPKIIALTGQLIPVITGAIDQLFGDGFDALINDVVSAIPQIITALLNAIPTLLNAVTNIITSVLNALVNNLPKILKAITDAVPKIIKTLLTKLTTIVKALVAAIPTILTTIIDALSTITKMLPEVVKMIVKVLPELITSIIEGLLGNLPLIIEGLVTLVLGIVEAIPQITEALVDAVPIIIESLLTAILNCLPSIITGIIKLEIAIAQQMPSILKSLWSSIVATLKVSFLDIPKLIINILPKIITALEGIFTGVLNACNDFGKEIGDWFFKTEIGKFFVDLATFMSMLFNEVKSFLTQLFVPITEFCTKVFDRVKTVFSNIFNKVKEVFTNIFNTVRERLTSIYNTVSNIFNNIYNVIRVPIENAKNAVSSSVNSMKANIVNVFNSIYSVASSIFNSIKNAIVGPMETAKNLVSNAIASMRKTINNAGFNLPHIKLPHFKISGSFNLRPPSVPHFAIDWYDKGYDEAQILKDATVFGMANGNLLAGGEHGNEVVVGEQHLLDMISSVVNPAPIVVNVYGAPGQDEDTLARIVIDKIQDITDSKEVVYA